MPKDQADVGIWADKGEMNDSNPRYLHARLLSGSGYTPEPVRPSEGWVKTHGPHVHPIEHIQGDDWEFLEQSEDLSPASCIQVAIAILQGFRHLRDSKRAIVWDTKPEHFLRVCLPDHMAEIFLFPLQFCCS